MQKISIISVGAQKEDYFKAASAEYEKRLSALCRLSNISLKEEKIKNENSPAEIFSALEKEGAKILAALPKRAYKIALCIEGAEYTSEGLARRLDTLSTSFSEVCFIIGSSHGLSDSVKSACDEKFSLSRLTFPHRLARVLLHEAVYRALSINAGGKYHK